ncbi:MAG: acyl-CoA thioesterase-1 [Desulforhopalus sp.]
MVNMVKNLLIAMLFIVAVISAGCSDEQLQADTHKKDPGENVDMKKIVALGDSLTAGFGVDLSESYPALLEKKLQENGYQYTVINAGVSGETSSGTLARVEWILTQDPEIVIVETGANDGLRGVAVSLLEENLREIVEMLHDNNVAVLLGGMKMVWNLGPAYVSQFNKVYPKIADERDVELIPFFLEGVATKSDLNSDDGIHPNSAGYMVIVENIYPYVVKVIDSVDK